jgi:hypothetical protein
VRENEERKRRERVAVLQRQAEEWEAVQKLIADGELCISQLGKVPTNTRLRLLQWIGRCNAAERHAFVTPEGVRVTMLNPATQERTILLSDDGELELPNYKFTFAWGDGVREVAASMEGFH